MAMTLVLGFGADVAPDQPDERAFCVLLDNSLLAKLTGRRPSFIRSSRRSV